MGFNVLYWSYWCQVIVEQTRPRTTYISWYSYPHREI